MNDTFAFCFKLSIYMKHFKILNCVFMKWFYVATIESKLYFYEHSVAMNRNNDSNDVYRGMQILQWELSYWKF